VTSNHNQLLYRLKRAMYPRNRPNATARFLNRVSAAQFAAGFLAPRRAVTLEVTGRRSGRTISFPLVLVDVEDGRYLVSMLGEDVNWVRNVRAAHGQAVLRHGRSEPVRLTEVDPNDRAPILRRYLDLAPGARPHIPVERKAPLPEFAGIADRYPVFRVTTDQHNEPQA
jgi:deazaflavin-dependent oxidoreductase (nitroreductase family)